METFINNVFMDSILNADEQTIIKNTMYQSFYRNKNIDTDTDKNIEKLEFISIKDQTGIFKYKNKFLYYNIEDDTEEWYTMYYEVLNNDNKYTSNLVKIINNSDKNIEYVLYPFFTEEESNEFVLNPECIVDITNSKQIICEHCIDDCIVIDWKDDIQLFINISDNTYIVKKDGNFMSGFNDTPGNFQLGDYGTIAYILNNGDIMIYNYGDVTSAVIIRVL